MTTDIGYLPPCIHKLLREECVKLKELGLCTGEDVLCAKDWMTSPAKYYRARGKRFIQSPEGLFARALTRLSPCLHELLCEDCQKLKETGVCSGQDELCARDWVTKPITYLRARSKTFRPAQGGRR